MREKQIERASQPIDDSKVNSWGRKQPMHQNHHWQYGWCISRDACALSHSSDVSSRKLQTPHSLVEVVGDVQGDLDVRCLSLAGGFIEGAHLLIKLQVP